MNQSAHSLYSSSGKNNTMTRKMESLLKREKDILGIKSPKRKLKNKKKLSKNLSNEINKTNGVKKEVKTDNVTINDITFSKQPQSTPLIKHKSDGGSVEEGRKEFLKLIHPVTTEDFMKKYWEKNPLLIRREEPKHYKNLISIQSLDQILKDNVIEFTKNIDVTSYEDGVRSTLNPVGRAQSSMVWEFYGKGCSIRFLNPQSYFKEIYEMNGALQEYFHTMVGTNMYLTPPNSQGFAPHYDDIEAFVLQVEGKKRWRLYKPRNETEYLPRVSSANFSQDEIGKPILDTVLEAGDMLYFPRGIIHQALTVENCHSLHITTSVYQKTSWADLMETLVPAALANAVDTDKRFREGIPLDLHQNLGVVFSDTDSPKRREAIKTIKGMFDRLFDNAPIDSAVDQMALKYQQDALPPVMTPAVKAKTVFGQKIQVTTAGTVEIPFKFTLKTRVRLLKANILRMVREENVNRIYYHVDNSKVYHEFEPVSVDIDDNDAPAVEMLIKYYPEYVEVKDLPLQEKQSKIEVVEDLFNRGLLMTD